MFEVAYSVTSIGIFSNIEAWVPSIKTINSGKNLIKWLEAEMRYDRIPVLVSLTGKEHWLTIIEVSAIISELNLHTIWNFNTDIALVGNTKESTLTTDR